MSSGKASCSLALYEQVNKRIYFNTRWNRNSNSIKLSISVRRYWVNSSRCHISTFYQPELVDRTKTRLRALELTEITCFTIFPASRVHDTSPPWAATQRLASTTTTLFYGLPRFGKLYRTNLRDHLNGCNRVFDSLRRRKLLWNSWRDFGNYSGRIAFHRTSIKLNNTRTKARRQSSNQQKIVPTTYTGFGINTSFPWECGRRKFDPRATAY